MKRFFIKTFSVLFLVISFTVSPAADKKTEKDSGITKNSTIRIASFNMQIFGKTKLRRSNTMSVLAGIASNFDIIALQEVGSNRSSASEETCIEIMDTYLAEINEIAGENLYSYICGNQYAIVYRTDRIGLNDYTLYDGDESFSYTPLIANFKTIEEGTNFDFSLITIHTSPNLAEDEIPALKEVIAETEILYKEPDVICLGDFNADGTYYDEGNTDFLSGFDEDLYITGIPNNFDTTIAESENTYDRIQMTASLDSDFTGKSGVFKFENYYDISLCEGTKKTSGTTKSISDHYPVWCMYYTDRDQD